MSDKGNGKKSKKMKDQKVDPDVLLGMDESLPYGEGVGWVDEAQLIANPEHAMVFAELSDKVKSFTTKVKFLEGQECPECGKRTVIVNNEGIHCVSCHTPIELSIVGVEGETLEPAAPFITTLEYIVDNLVPEFTDMFKIKNADYGDGARVLGIKGQYSDLNRKMTKLKRSLWDGEELAGEQPREILMDLVGHCFLTIDMLDEEGSEVVEANPSSI